MRVLDNENLRNEMTAKELGVDLIAEIMNFPQRTVEEST
jgi:hypothetical protein